MVAETRYPGEDSGGSYPSMYILERARRVKMTKDDRFRFFSVVSSKKTRNGHKSKYTKFHLNIRNFLKNFILIKMVKDWIRLPRQVVEFLLLELFNTQVDVALSSLWRLALL